MNGPGIVTIMAIDAAYSMHKRNMKLAKQNHKITNLPIPR